jgi:hypothetical protein
MQWSYWQFWGYSACTFGILIAIPLWLLKLTKDEIDSARRMISQQHNRPEFKKGSMILYGDFMAADRLYFEARMRKIDLKKLEASDESFVGDGHRLARVKKQCKEYKKRFHDTQEDVAAFHAIHTRASAVMALHTGLKTGEYYHN